MKYQSEIHHRRSIRLKEYDYSQENAYFVTICAQHKQCYFGEIQDGQMFLNHAGLMTLKWYQVLSQKFTNLQCGEFVCMPNHIHFIINITAVLAGAHLIQPRACEKSDVGAHPRVRPDETLRQNKAQGQIHRSESKGQTRRSAPTASPTESDEVTQS